MNTERLKIVLKAIKENFDKSEIAGSLAELGNTVENYVSNQQPVHLEAMTQARQKVKVSLSKSNYSKFPRTWNSVLKHLKYEEFSPEYLAGWVDLLFSRNQVEINVVRDEINQRLKAIGEYRSVIDKTLEGFESLEIEDEALGPGEGELSILMPGEAVSEDLQKFADEIKFFNRMISYFIDLIDQDSDGPSLKQISSSDPTFFVSVSPFVVPVILFLVCCSCNTLPCQRNSGDSN